MLHKISLGITDIDRYRLVQSREVIDELVQLGEDLKGLRVCHINSTPFGGGVAELLISYIPILRGLGVEADWQVIRGDARFFGITKSLHNALQGAPYPDIRKDNLQRVYRANNIANASELDPDYDVFIVNDPQPAALRYFLPQSRAKWIWRCHVDSGNPDKDVWDFLSPYVELYDAAVFTLPEFVPANLKVPVIADMPPAISPFSSKNMDLDRKLCRELIDNLGFDHEARLITQVSRFDRWKDPFGTIAAFRMAREVVPNIQLALVGSFASDDPEGWDMHAALSDEAVQSGDLMILSNLSGVGNMEVNAFQRGSDIIVQKSIREGFGLVVAEALWKETPVVAGDAGGIPMQMTGGLNDYLVTTVEQCAEKLIYLLQNPDVGAALGKEGREVVRDNFLLTRLARDELRLIKKLVG